MRTIASLIIPCIITTVDALGASLHELASCCSEAAVHSSNAQIPQRRRSNVNMSAVM